MEVAAPEAFFSFEVPTDFFVKDICKIEVIIIIETALDDIFLFLILILILE